MGQNPKIKLTETMKTSTIPPTEKQETNSAFTRIPIIKANKISDTKQQKNQHMKTSDTQSARISFFGLIPRSAHGEGAKDNSIAKKISLMKKLISRSIIFAIVLLISNLFLVINSYSQTTETFNANGSFIPPAGVTSVTVQAWGGGGAGGGVTRTSGGGTVNGGGGAGGAYASSILSVTPGTPYTVTVGVQKTATATSTAATNTGNFSWFGSASTVYAQGGPGGGPANNGTGTAGIGSSSSSIGTTVTAGVSGAAGNTGTVGSTGGAGANGGGAGGAGINNTNSNGNSGTAPGGGGSGGRTTSSGTFNGGTGAAGRVLVTYTCPTYTLSSLLSATRCSGVSASYTATSATSGLTYSWTRATVPGISNSAGSGSGATATETLVNTTALPVNVTYIFTLTSGSCSNTQSVIVTVYPEAAITGSINVCFNYTTQLSGSGTPAAINPWVSSDPTKALVDNNGLVTGVAPGQSTITYTNNFGCSNSVLITVFETAVGGTASATSADICYGASTTLILAGSIGSVQWQQSVDGNDPWTNVTTGSGGTTPVYTTSNLTATTFYKAEVNHICPVVYSTVAQVTVKAALAQFNVTGATTICANSSANIFLSGSVLGVNYELRDNSTNNLIGIAVSGSGDPLTFPTGNVPKIGRAHV